MILHAVLDILSALLLAAAAGAALVYWIASPRVLDARNRSAYRRAGHACVTVALIWLVVAGCVAALVRSHGMVEPVGLVDWPALALCLGIAVWAWAGQHEARHGEPQGITARRYGDDDVR